MSNPRVTLVACCGPKLSHAAPAQELYRSPLFLKARAWARAHGDSWLILSALHGVVAPEAVLEPYDVELRKLTPAQRASWALRVREQLSPLNPYVCLAGELYCAWIDATYEVERPLKGMGIGQQLSWLTKELHGLQRT